MFISSFTLRVHPPCSPDGVRVRILLITEPCVFHIHSHPPPFRTTLILILHDIQTSDPSDSCASDPPCSCSVFLRVYAPSSLSTSIRHAFPSISQSSSSVLRVPLPSVFRCAMLRCSIRQITLRFVRVRSPLIGHALDHYFSHLAVDSVL